MKTFTRSARSALLAAFLSAITLLVQPSPSAAQAPHYTNGMTGTFGSVGGWSDNANAMTLNSINDEFSTRFTAYENLTVDRAWQSYVGMEAGTTIRLGIMADDGAGHPSGTYLASGTLSFGVSGTYITNVVFSGSATLTNGGVYHLVTQVPTIVGDFIVRFGGSETIRPYDRAVDTNVLSVVRRFDGGAWGGLSGNGFFALGNGSTTLSGPGQPYDSPASANHFTTTGGSGTAAGQQFMITDKEIPNGFSVLVSTIDMRLGAVAGTANNLIVRLRETNGTILASATMPVSLADGVTHTLSLDGRVELQEGVPYLLTTQFGGASTGTEVYRFYGVVADAALGAATWGGSTWAFPIRSGAANNWSTYTAYPGRPSSDLLFSFQGLVIPEPSSVVLLTMIGALFLRRRLA